MVKIYFLHQIFWKALERPFKWHIGKVCSISRKKVTLKNKKSLTFCPRIVDLRHCALRWVIVSCDFPTWFYRFCSLSGSVICVQYPWRLSLKPRICIINSWFYPILQYNSELIVELCSNISVQKMMFSTKAQLLRQARNIIVRIEREITNKWLKL